MATTNIHNVNVTSNVWLMAVSLLQSY